MYLILFNKPKKSMRPFELILISITNNPEDIKKGKSGILIPKFAPTSIFGMGVSDLGYYILFD